MNGDRCVKPNCGCATKMSSTIYWCEECNIPIYENVCPKCGAEGKYISTDLRPVFPEENALISLILKNDPTKYQKSSVWYGSGMYIIDGKKVRLSVSKVNALPIEEIKLIKEKYDAFANEIQYDFFGYALVPLQLALFHSVKWPHLIQLPLFRCSKEGYLSSLLPSSHVREGLLSLHLWQCDTDVPGLHCLP